MAYEKNRFGNRMSRKQFGKIVGLAGAGVAAGAVGLGGVAHATGLPAEVVISNPNGSYNGHTFQDIMNDSDVLTVLFDPNTEEYTLGEITISNDKMLAALDPSNRPVLNACFNVDAQGCEVAFENLVIESTRSAWDTGTIHNIGSDKLVVRGVYLHNPPTAVYVHGIFNQPVDPEKITGETVVEDCEIFCDGLWNVAIANEDLQDVNLFITRNHLRGGICVMNAARIGDSTDDKYQGTTFIDHNDLEMYGSLYDAFSFGVWISNTNYLSSTLIKSNYMHYTPRPDDIPALIVSGFIVGARGPATNVVAVGNKISCKFENTLSNCGVRLGEYGGIDGDVNNNNFIGNEIDALISYLFMYNATGNVVRGEGADTAVFNDNTKDVNFVTGATPMAGAQELDVDAMSTAFRRARCELLGGTWDEATQSCQ
jgi:hypothetical protein